MTYVDHLHGPALLAALCLVIFVEECGVPVPFAPGDLLLVACGLAIRSRGVDPLIAVPAVYLTTIAGAMTGREVFDVAGARLLGDRSRYRAFAASLVLACCLAFVTYVLLPTQPPWLGHPQDVHKVIDETIGKLGLPGWLVGFYQDRDYNVHAAFPSLHAAFPLIATLHAWPRSRSLGVLLGAWTLVVWVAVVYLGEHYVIDVLAGIAYAMAAVLVVAWWRRGASRRTAPVGS